MAGHSKFKNIMHHKGAQDAKRAKRFAKLVKEIIVAIKSSGGEINAEFNPRLRQAITSAKAANLPKDRIDNAIKKASSPAEGDNFEEIRYECYAPGGVALLIDCLTDNRNRSASDVKTIINKNGSTLAEPGSVSYMFDRVGLVEYKDSSESPDKILELTIESGADECDSDEFDSDEFESNKGEILYHHKIYCNTDALQSVKDFLAKKIGEPSAVGLFWKPQNIVEVSDEGNAEKLMKIIDALEDCDDVQNIFGNHKIIFASKTL